MGKFVFAIGASLAISMANASASANDRQMTLDPSSKWNVHFAPNKCRLGRLFGEGDNRHMIFFEQHFPSTGAGLTIAGPSLKRFKSLKPTSLSLFSDQEPRETKPFKGDLGDYGPAVIYPGINLQYGEEYVKNSEGDAGEDSNAETDAKTDDSTSPALVGQLDTEFAAQVEFVGLSQGKRSVRLNTGPLGDAFKVLNKCTQDLIKEWGLDVDKHMTAQKMPEWRNQRRIVKRIMQVYPRRALNRGEQGIFRMRVMIDDTGTVTDCVINEATVADNLESPACKEMQKAKFAPALDAEGNPFPSYYTTSITYKMSN